MKLFLIICFVSSGTYLFAQTSLKKDKTGIHGVVFDTSNEPFCCAIVIVKKNGNQIVGTITDINGEYFIDTLEQGIYSIKASYRFVIDSINNVYIKKGQMITKNFKLNIQETIDSPVIIHLHEPWFDSSEKK